VLVAFAAGPAGRALAGTLEILIISRVAQAIRGALVIVLLRYSARPRTTNPRAPSGGPPRGLRSGRWSAA
jgi:hypothetical protein